VAKITRQPASISHSRAVLIIALVATIWGFGFPATRIVLDGGLSVGALMGLRFPLAGLVMFAIIRAEGIRINRRGVLDGIWLGLVLVAVFWLQTDGMRFTTTAKAGFITGLYVLFTPLVAVVIGQRVKLASALGALIAVYGMYLLVHLPGGGWSGHTPWGVFKEMNRGDVEILLCAILCGIHIVMMGAFTRRCEGVAAGGLAGDGLRRSVGRGHRVSALAVRISECLRGPVALAGCVRGTLPGARVHGLCFLGTGDRADPTRANRVGGAVQPGTGGGGRAQRGLAEGTDVGASGCRRRADRGGHGRGRGTALHVPRDHGARYQAVTNSQPSAFS
jgi:EamA-like transporter family